MWVVLQAALLPPVNSLSISLITRGCTLILQAYLSPPQKKDT